MFKIFAVICFLSVGDLGHNLCFKSEVPLEFKDIPSCEFVLDNLIDYMDKDLKERQTTIIFKCKNNETINL